MSIEKTGNTGNMGCWEEGENAQQERMGRPKIPRARRRWRSATMHGIFGVFWHR